MALTQCENHSKMVQKSELQWIIGVLTVVFTFIFGITYANSASKDKVEGIQRQVDAYGQQLRDANRKLDDIHGLLMQKVLKP